MVVDSGAGETVMSPDHLPQCPREDSDDSRSHQRYEVANGESIPAMGQKRFTFVTVNGVSRRVCAQITKVNKALLSVSQVCGKDHRVVFDKVESYIEDKVTGERIPLEEKNGTYSLLCWVRNGPNDTEMSAQRPATFAGQRR